MENVPMPLKLERDIIKGKVSNQVFNILAKAVINLNKAEADFIVIPCNTVHVFIKGLRSLSNKPILSIIEECAEECKRINIKKVGLLATTTTINQNLHKKELDKISINLVLPKNQSSISRVILNILNNKADEEDKKVLVDSINDMKNNGAEAVILGCTDLNILINENDSPLPLIDTIKILEDKAVKLLS